MEIVIIERSEAKEEREGDGVKGGEEAEEREGM